DGKLCQSRQLHQRADHAAMQSGQKRVADQNFLERQAQRQLIAHQLGAHAKKRRVRNTPERFGQTLLRAHGFFPRRLAPGLREGLTMKVETAWAIGLSALSSNATA